MKNELHDTIIQTYNKLPDSEIENAVFLTAKMLCFEAPVWEPEMSKDEYLNLVSNCIHCAVSKIGAFEGIKKTFDVLHYAEQQSPGFLRILESQAKAKEPGFWARFMTALKQFSLFNFINKSN